jgi:hypothetical protein
MDTYGSLFPNIAHEVAGRLDELVSDNGDPDSRPSGVQRDGRASGSGSPGSHELT